MATITDRGVDELPVLEEYDDPEFGADFGWVTADLYARPYQGLMRTSGGDVIVYRNADLAALRAHPAVGHQPVDVMFDGFGDVDTSGLNRLFAANPFSWLPPEHKPGKQLLMKLFTTRNVARFHQDFSGIVGSLLDVAVERGEIDFVSDISRPAVAQFWSRALGLTLEESDSVVALAARVQRSIKVAPTTDDIIAANRCAYEYMDVLYPGLARAAATGDHPLLSELVSEHEAMGPVGRPDDPFPLVGSALLDGFHTLGAIFGAVVFALLDAGLQPQAQGREITSFATAAYQEGSRLHPSVTVLPRRAAKDFVYDGVLIPKDTDLHMAWLLGNRDPEVFDDPARYLLDRPNRVKQYSFGGGFYVCAGRNVVQALSEILLATLAERSVTIEMTGSALWDPGSMLHELTTFPVAIRQG